VVTVFAGGPASVDPLPTVWDALSGVLRPGDDVPAIRRSEDAAACALVGAVPHHLPFWDEEYRNDAYSYDGPHGAPLLDEVAEALNHVMRQSWAEVWVMPLGLLHHDHQLTAAACLRAFTEVADDPALMPAREFMLYRELPHMLDSPEAVEAAERMVHAVGFELAPAEVALSSDLARKRASIACHLSQLEMLWACIDTAVIAPETFYFLQRR
jgi:LmbE family N-acetylglucosaminyl deacetylase